MDKITVRNFINKSEFEIKEDGVSYYTRTLFDTQQGFIPFNELGGRVMTHVKRDSTFLALGIGGILFGIVFYFVDLSEGETAANTHAEQMMGPVIGICGVLAGIGSLIFYWLNTKGGTYMKKSNNSSSLIIPPNKNQKEVDLFVENLLSKRNNYLLNKYERLIKTYTEKEQKINVWHWLYNEKVISDEIFAEKMEMLNQSGYIGFD